MRKLATVEKIKDIKPIPNADKIEVARVKGWQVVVRKGEYQVGQQIIYLEVDSWVPCDLAPFLCNSQAKTYMGITGTRLKTIKLRGQVSQGLILPLDILEGKLNNIVFPNSQITEGFDLTNILNIKKYESQNVDFDGSQSRPFPSFIPKTEQERIQNLSSLPENVLSYEATEKLDGSSMTVYAKDGELGVCSRNIELDLDANDSLFIQAYNNFNEKQKRFLLENNFAVQGELIGPKIQGNHYKLTEYKYYVYNLFDIKNYLYIPPYKAKKMVEEAGFEYVPIIDIPHDIKTLEDYLNFAEGKSILNPKVHREGVVFKDNESENSFKVISNSWLLNEK